MKLVDITWEPLLAQCHPPAPVLMLWSSKGGAHGSEGVQRGAQRPLWTSLPCSPATPSPSGGWSRGVAGRQGDTAPRWDSRKEAE